MLIQSDKIRKNELYVQKVIRLCVQKPGHSRIDGLWKQVITVKPEIKFTK